jgi:hypothetical protein
MEVSLPMLARGAFGKLRVRPTNARIDELNFEMAHYAAVTAFRYLFHFPTILVRILQGIDNES